MKNALFAALAILSWAALNLLLRGMKDVWPVNLAGALSRVVTLSVLTLWVLWTGDGWRRLRPRGTGRLLLIMGAVAISINLLWYNAMEWTSATNVALLFRLDLVFVVLIGSFLGLEHIGRRQVLLLPITFVGLALFTEIQHFDFGGHLMGDLMVVGAALGYAINAFIIRRILRVMDEEAVSLYNLSLSGLGFVVLSLMNGDFTKIPVIGASAIAWSWIVVFGITGAIALPLYYAALRRMAVWKLRTFMLAAPIVVALVEWPIWGIRLTRSQCAGGCLILAALAVLIQIEQSEANAKQSSASGDQT